MQAAVEISKKRSLEDNALDRPVKRVYSSTSHKRRTGDTNKRPSRVNRTANRDSQLLVLEGKVQAIPVGTQTQVEGAYVQHARSGRTVRLPTRFR